MTIHMQNVISNGGCHPCHQINATIFLFFCINLGVKLFILNDERRELLLQKFGGGLTYQLIEVFDVWGPQGRDCL